MMRRWGDELRRQVTSVAELEKHVVMTEQERTGAVRAQRTGMPIAITPYYLSLIDRNDPRCPIRLMCVPRADEAIEVHGDDTDPLGEKTHEVAPHLIRRYPDRALLLVSDLCAVHCRFCTRSRMVGRRGGVRPIESLAPAFAWLDAHPEVHDVIVSGGDPLIMSTGRLCAILARIRRSPGVETIRLATRVPVTLPSRVTAELVKNLRRFHPLFVMTHFNHPKELTAAAETACRRLVDGGFPVMNQTVLLRGVNDDTATLEQLFRGLVRWRVRPYYLMQADLVRGTAHLRTPLEVGRLLMRQLQERLTGIALPKLVVDAPGGKGKVPVGPDYIVSRSRACTVLRTGQGRTAEYVDPPPTLRPSRKLSA
jgi:lysine 2,3-aminomutase